MNARVALLFAVVSLAAPALAAEKADWAANMRWAMPEQLCSDGKATRNCYCASQAQCLAVQGAAADACLKQLDAKLPKTIDQASGASFGVDLGLCMANSYEELMADLFKDDECTIGLTPDQAVAKKDWSALVDERLAARLCAAETSFRICSKPDEEACRKAVKPAIATCRAAQNSKLPAKVDHMCDREGAACDRGVRRREGGRAGQARGVREEVTLMDLRLDVVGDLHGQLAALG